MTKLLSRNLVAILLLAAPIFAAANFSGEWKLNLSKSDYGQAPTPEFATRNIKHNDPNLAISSHQKGAAGEVTSEFKYTTDGKEVVNKLPTGESKGAAKWDGDKLVIENVRQIQGYDIKSREVWTLSADGKTLTIQNHLSLPQQGEFDVKQVFDKQ